MEVIQAASGADGVEKAREERPDVILLDMMMPTMDGSETLAALRGAGVLIKPFDPRTLSDQVRALVKQSLGS